MLQIRPEQMKVFEQAAILDFGDRMLAHIKKFFPARYEELGKENCRGLVGYCIHHAAQYGITSEIDVAGYIDLSVVLGRDFDSIERHPWIVQVLNDPTLKPSSKVQQIFDLMKRAREAKNRTLSTKS